MISIGERLDRRERVGPGFDQVRLLLAALVVVIHSFRVEFGPTGSMGYGWVVGEIVVPMFFVVSGFLVAASAQNHRPRRFFENRFLRIYPALILCVLLSALIMGPLVTTLPLREYFTSPNFRQYLLVLVGRAHFSLPGVFEASPDAEMVNVSLWTVRWEIGCYALIGLAAASGLLRRTRLAVGFGLAIILLPVITFLSVHAAIAFGGASASTEKLIEPHDYFFVEAIPMPQHSAAGIIYWILEVLGGWNFRIVPFFCAGTMAYILRYRLPYSPPLALAMGLIIVLAGFIVREDWNGPLLYLLLCAPAVYLVVWCGVTALPAVPLLRRGDYSYGIYLYGFPIQQLVRLSGVDHRVWWLNSIFSLLLVLPLAMISWHLLERRILRRRSAAARRFVTREAGASPA